MEHRRYLAPGLNAVLALCGILGILLVVVASCVWLLIGGPAGIDTIATIVEVPSPDRAWMVRVDELEDEGYLGAGVIFTNVHLAPAGGKAKGVDILAVDSDGHDANRPRIAWTAANVLQVTVRNLSYVTIYRREFAGIRIDVRFDPPDPATRAAWLKWLKAPRPPETSTRIAEVPSPDGAWIAAMMMKTGGDRFFSDYAVQLIPPLAAADAVLVLSEEATELGREPPRIAWTAANVLAVTVPNLAAITYRKREYDSVRIDLRFDPDEPAARAAWRKQRHAPDDPPADESNLQR